MAITRGCVVLYYNVFDDDVRGCGVLHYNVIDDDIQGSVVLYYTLFGGNYSGMCCFRRTKRTSRTDRNRNEETLKQASSERELFTRIRKCIQH